MNNSPRKVQRPLSPHLLIYKPQITTVLSILHRITGAFLSLGSLVMAYWFYAAAYDMVAYERFVLWFTSIFGQLLLIAWSAAFYYHLCNGMRHIMWDMGKGLEIHTVARTGWVVLALSASLTAATWINILGVH